MEGVEGNTDGQAQTQGLQKAQGGEHSPEIGDDKVIVLEKDQKSQVDDHRAGHYFPAEPVVFPVAGNEQAMAVIHQNGEDHDEHINGLAPAVEDQVENQKGQVPPSAGGYVIDAQRQGQIEKQKEYAAENHRSNAPTWIFSKKKGPG